MTRAERRARTEAKTAYRQKFLRRMDDDRSTRSPGCWAKRHPYDCGRTRCSACHWEKLNQNRATERRAAQREIDE